MLGLNEDTFVNEGPCRSQDVLDYSHFEKLRLEHFTDQTQIIQLDNWLFLGHLWVGEAIGFSEWLRLKDDPDSLRSLSLDVDELPKHVWEKVLDRLGLCLWARMTAREVERALGECREMLSFAPDRTSYEFTSKYPTYDISCTMHHEKGLIYVVVTMPLPEPPSSH